jgi:quinol-cytochrome oxidoreductase complex cytochrome b subunit
MTDHSQEKPFFPYYFFEVAVVALLTLEAVLLLAVLFPPALGREIDLGAQYAPRPEWYFLFLYFPGRWTFVGAVLLPGMAFSILLLAPFLDGSAERSLHQRPIAAASGTFMLVAVMTLTFLSLL